MTEYGRDISCTDSLRVGRTSTGVRLVAEAAYRRLTTPRGMLRGSDDEQNYGLDLSDLIGAKADSATAASIPGIIRNELTKDERILSVDVDVVDTGVAPAVGYSVTVSAETNEGPFSLQLAVDDVDVALLGITTEAT